MTSSWPSIAKAPGFILAESHNKTRVVGLIFWRDSHLYLGYRGAPRCHSTSSPDGIIQNGRRDLMKSRDTSSDNIEI